MRRLEFDQTDTLAKENGERPEITSRVLYPVYSLNMQSNTPCALKPRGRQHRGQYNVELSVSCLYSQALSYFQ